ncbi:MAG: hypothetical protein JNL10_17340 [Verrucomicrobiales bacterium]|nr:hypothetical protein [Verrucomicrobiales bacterium]
MSLPTLPRPTRSFRRRGADVLLVSVREMKVLLGLVFVLFLTTEVWRFVGRLDSVRLIVLVGGITAASMIILIAGLRRTLPTTMGRRSLMLATRRVVGEVLAFGITLGAAFIVFGFLTMDRVLVEEWSGAAANLLWTCAAGGWRFDLTRPLIQVSAFLGSISMVAFALEVLTDAHTRHSLVGDLIASDAGRRPIGAGSLAK